jgi:branched-subunit amino acid permease
MKNTIFDIAAAVVLLSLVIHRAAAVTIQINTNLPGVTSGAGVTGFVSGFYNFALLFAGILAFGAIVYGGIKYAVSRGNPSAESEGRSWVTDALLGLLLLAGAYIILHAVNPNIVNLNLPL